MSEGLAGGVGEQLQRTGDEAEQEEPREQRTPGAAHGEREQIGGGGEVGGEGSRPAGGERGGGDVQRHHQSEQPQQRAIEAGEARRGEVSRRSRRRWRAVRGGRRKERPEGCWRAHRVRSLLLTSYMYHHRGAHAEL